MSTRGAYGKALFSPADRSGSPASYAPERASRRPPQGSVIRLLAAAFAILPAGCAPSSDRPRTATLDSLPRWEGFVLTPDSVHLFTRIVGAGRDTIIVLHGGPGFTLDYLAADLEPLAARHTLLFYDQRGAGRSTLVSDSAGLSAQRFVDDLEAIRARFGLSKPALLGHSWGVGLAALYVQRYPNTMGPPDPCRWCPAAPHKSGRRLRSDGSRS